MNVSKFLRTISIVVSFSAAVLPVRTSANPGDLYATDDFSVHKYAPSGSGTVFSSGLLRPRGLVFDKFGQLFGSTLDTMSRGDEQGRIVQYAADGTATTSETGLINPEQTVLNHAPKIYVGQGGAGNNSGVGTSPALVYEIKRQGTVGTFAAIDDNQLHQFFGAGFNDKGDLFVADSYGNVFEISHSGQASLFATVAPTPNTTPCGIAIDDEDNVFVSTFGDIGEIIEIAPDGTQTVYAVIPSDSDLRGLIFDKQGNLFVAGHGSGNIYKVAPDRTITVFATGLSRPQFFAIEP